MANEKYVIIPMEEYEELKNVQSKLNEQTEEQKSNKWKADMYDNLLERYENVLTESSRRGEAMERIGTENFKLKKDVEKLKSENEKLKEFYDNHSAIVVGQIVRQK